MVGWFHAVERSTEEVFTRIYQKGSWSEDGFSFSGSQLYYTKPYILFLQEFLKKNHIATVVDVGCGDWQTFRYINWEGIQYTGYDVVPSIIDRNSALFGQPSIQFIHADALTIPLPSANLLICKDVLQHLPNQEVQKLIAQLYKFKHCLIINDVNPQTLSSKNPDIEKGDYRPIDLTQPPFNVVGEKLLTYRAGPTTKQVLYVRSR